VALPEPASLWRHADFLKFWLGQTTSIFGSQVGIVALPMLAVIGLHASVEQMGALAALGRLPYVLILFVGVWVDTVRRRPLLIVSDIARGLLVLAIPVLYLTDHLTMGWIFGVITGVGVFSVIFDIGAQAYVPSLVDRQQLPEANSKFQLSWSTGEVAGPGIVAVLLRWLSAGTLMFIDAVSFLVSATSMMLIGRREEKPAGHRTSTAEKGPGLFPLIWAGLRWVWGQPLLRPTLIASTFFFFFAPAIQAVYLFYAYHTLHVPPSWIAVVLMLSGPGAIIGAALGPRIIKRIGLGRMCVIAALGGNTSFLLIPFAGGPRWLAVGILGAANLAYGFTMPLGSISTTTISQALTPPQMLGRMAATFRAFSVGLSPAGAFLAGVLASVVGLRVVIFAAAVGLLVPVLILFLSPLPKLREVPNADSGIEPGAGPPDSRPAPAYADAP
jgi:predicted MFS family arabinose efflux permease